MPNFYCFLPSSFCDIIINFFLGYNIYFYYILCLPSGIMGEDHQVNEVDLGSNDQKTSDQLHLFLPLSTKALRLISNILEVSGGGFDQVFSDDKNDMILRMLMVETISSLATLSFENRSGVNENATKTRCA